LRESIAEKVNYELALLDGEIKATPKFLLPAQSNCLEIQDRPNLDGRLSEICWRSAPATPVLINADPNHNRPLQAQVQFCRDAEHLYIAIACEKFAKLTYKPSLGQRKRDAQIDGTDRVTIQLDLDRWSVSNNETETLWMVEAAIPLSAISPTKIRPNDRWNVRLSRGISPTGVRSLGQDSEKAQSIFLHRPLPKLENTLSF